MPDVENLHYLAVDRWHDPVDVRTAAVEQLPNFTGESRFSGASGQREGSVVSDAIAAQRVTNQRSLASPACCKRNQS
jgi:hypothetical protein